MSHGAYILVGRQTSKSANSTIMWCQTVINALKEIKQCKGVGASLVSQKNTSLRVTFVWSIDWHEEQAVQISGGGADQPAGRANAQVLRRKLDGCFQET